MSRYFIQRCILHLKNKGFFSFIKNAFNHILYILNPAKVGEFPFIHLFKKKRILNKKFIKKNLSNFDKPSIERYFNYYLDTSKINDNAIVYGFGIGGQIKFEEAIAKKFTNSKIYCYDPTAKYFIDRYLGPKNIKLFPFGIWTEDKKVNFFHTDDDFVTGSITDLFNTKEKYVTDYQCHKLKTLMSMNNHYNIDILKMDIEGVGGDVLDDILNDQIFPTQILIEFEFSEVDNLSKDQEEQYFLYELKLAKLLNKMKSYNYKCYNMHRVNMPYASIEVLFVKQF
tara:strand:- start:854 stop:1702 length:849 start_codon:yes stop_codon:yes gene_type:complete